MVTLQLCVSDLLVKGGTSTLPRSRKGSSSENLLQAEGGDVGVLGEGTICGGCIQLVFRVTSSRSNCVPEVLRLVLGR